jgi:hypothetical protein
MRLVLVVAVLAWMPAGTATGQEVPEVRRIFVPSERVTELLRGSDEWLVLPRDDFERLLRRARVADAWRGARVDRLKLTARLDGRRLVGEATCDLTGSPDTENLLRWPVSALLIRNPRWAGGAAKIGYLAGDQLGLLVPAGRTHGLQFGWSVAGRDGEDGLRFEPRWPTATVQELELELPGELEPHWPGAVLTAAAATEGPLVRWTARWGPATPFRLTLRSRGGSVALPPLVVYRSDDEIDLSESNGDFTTQLAIEVLHQPLSRIEIDLAPGLTAYEWTGIDVQSARQVGTRLTLDLQQPLAGRATLRLRAVGVLAMNERTELPRATVAGGLSLSGRTTLRLAPGVEWTDVEMKSARLVPGPRSATDRTAFVLERFSADATISGRLVAVTVPPAARVLTRVDIGGRLAGKSRVHWQVAGDSQSLFQMLVPDTWLVDQVTCEGSTLAGWSTSGGPAPDQTVTVRTSQPVRTGGTLDLDLEMTGLSFDLQSARTEGVVPHVRPVHARVLDDSITIEPGTRWLIDWSASPRIRGRAAASLPGGIPKSTTARAFQLDAAGGPMPLVLTRRPVSWSARVATEVEVGERDCRTVYTLDLDAIEGQPDAVDVRLSATPPGRLTWSPALRVEATEDGTRAWRIHLPSGVQWPLRLKAEWQAARSGPIEVPFAAVPQANAITGDVAVSAAATPAIAVDSSGIEWLSRGAADVGTRRVWSGRYSSDTPRLVLRPRDPTTTAPIPASITHTQLVTTVDGTGSTRQRLSWRVSARGDAVLHVRLPADARLHGAWTSLDRREQRGSRPGASTGPNLPAVGDARELRLRCPAGWSTATVDYEATGRSARLVLPVQVVLPRFGFDGTGDCPGGVFSWELIAEPGFVPGAWPTALDSLPPRAEHAPARRLFGPFARREDDDPVAFWVPAVWNAASRGQSATPAARAWRQLDELIAQMSRADAESPVGLAGTWGSLLGGLDRHTGRRLVIDTIAARVLQIRPDTPLPRGDSAPSEFAAWLGRAQLVALAGRQAVLVTSRPEAARLASGDGTGLRGDAGVASAVTAALREGRDHSGRFQAVWQWAGRPPDSDAWRCEAESAAPAGYGVWRFVASEVPATVSLMLLPTALIGRAAALTVPAVLVLAWRLRRSPRWWRGTILGSLVTAAFGAAVVLPAPVVLPATAAGWTALVMLAVGMIRIAPRRTTAARRSGSSVIRVSPIQAGSGAAVAIFCLWGARDAASQPPVAPERPTPVFLPFDGKHPERAHESDRVLVPRPFKERLDALAERGTVPKSTALVQSATYRGLVNGQSLELTADLQLSSLESGGIAQCTLPLAGWSVRSARLDDRATAVVPMPGGLMVTTPAGDHHLRIDATLPLDGDGTATRVVLATPAVPDSRLELSLPAPGLSVEFESLVDQWSAEFVDNRTVLKANLAAVSQTRLAWRPQPAPPSKVTISPAYLYLLESSFVRVRAQLGVRVQNGSLGRLVLEPDAALRLERISAPAGATAWLRPAKERSQLVIEFARPIRTETNLTLDFLLVGGASATAQVPAVASESPVPLVELGFPGCEQSPTLLAVTTDAALAARFDGLQGWELIDTALFRNRWGEDSTSLPVVALRAAAASRRGTVAATRSGEPRSVSATDVVRVTPGRIELRAEWTLPTQGSAVSEQLRLPAGFVLGTVSLADGLHWSLDGPGTLFVRGAVDEGAPASMSVEGWVPAERDPCSLPCLVPVLPAAFSGSIDLYVARELELRVDALRNLVKAPESDAAPDDGLPLHSSYERTAGDAAATLAIVRRSPTVTAQVATRLLVDRQDAEWVAVVDYQIESGAAETFEVFVPLGVADPVRITGEGIVRQSSRAVPGGRAWTIQTAPAVAPAYRLTLQGRLPLGSGDVAVPAVRAERVTSQTCSLMVRNRVPDRPVQAVPGDAVAITEDRFARWFSMPQPGSAVGSFTLHDQPVRLHWPPAEPADATPAELLGGVILTDLSPQGRRAESIMLWLWSEHETTLNLPIPGDADLLDATLDGVRAPVARDRDGSVVVPLDAAARLQTVVLRWRQKGPAAPTAPSSGGVETTRLDIVRPAGVLPGPLVWCLRLPDGSRCLGSVGTVGPSRVSTLRAEVLDQVTARMASAPPRGRPRDREQALLAIERQFQALLDEAQAVFDRPAADQFVVAGWPTARLSRELDQVRARHAETLRRADLAKLATPRGESESWPLAPAGVSIPADPRTATTALPPALYLDAQNLRSLTVARPATPSRVRRPMSSAVWTVLGALGVIAVLMLDPVRWGLVRPVGLLTLLGVSAWLLAAPPVLGPVLLLLGTMLLAIRVPAFLAQRMAGRS